ncbi:MAG: tyrosine-type recombinase/integrase [Alphaproteobacteria bacterium]|nr:tyrosine-type recombinase/integrase [Alphaproteobacteria bacterium SS10]
MGKVNLKYVNSYRDRHGKWRYRFRRRGFKTVPLPPPTDPDFFAAYHNALSGTEHKTAQPKSLADYPRSTFGWLLYQYFQSHEFKRLAPHTRRSRRNMLDNIEGLENPFNQLRPRHIRTWRDERQRTPSMANRLIKTLRALFVWAMENDLAEENPARDVKLLKMNGSGFHTWTNEERAQFERHHKPGTKARLAYQLLLDTACRRQDVIMLGWQHVKDGWIDFRQKKTGARVEAPITADLNAEISQTKGQLTFLLTTHGKPFTHAGFGNWFKKQCREAGLPENCSAHGLRKASAKRIGDAGGTTLEIASITGHKSLRELETYVRDYSRRKSAGRAAEKVQKENQCD